MNFCNGCLIKDECCYHLGKLKHLQDFFCPINDILKIHQNEGYIPIRYQCVSVRELPLKNVKFYPDVLGFVDEDGGNIVFSGQISKGKTRYGCAVLNHYIVEKTRKEKGKTLVRDYPLVIYQDFPSLLDFLRYDKEGAGEKIEKIMNTSLLMLDDLDLVKVSDFVVEQTNIILNYRYNNKLSTIVTSTEPFKDLFKRFKCSSLEKIVKNSICIDL